MPFELAPETATVTCVPSFGCSAADDRVLE
jgi:hypothetical protein